MFVRIGKTMCFQCGKEVEKATTGTVADWLGTQNDGTRLYLTCPLHEH